MDPFVCLHMRYIGVPWFGDQGIKNTSRTCMHENSVFEDMGMHCNCLS